MDELIAFLEARLAEDEASAKAATAGEWYATGEDILTRGETPHWAGACVANATGADGEHIARHDPVRVLREVEAKRAIITMRREQVGYDLPPGVHERMRDEALVNMLDDVLRQFGVAYSWHPDYKPEWKP